MDEIQSTIREPVTLSRQPKFRIFDSNNRKSCPCYNGQLKLCFKMCFTFLMSAHEELCIQTTTRLNIKVKYKQDEVLLSLKLAPM